MWLARWVAESWVRLTFTLICRQIIYKIYVFTNWSNISRQHKRLLLITKNRRVTASPETIESHYIQLLNMYVLITRNKISYRIDDNRKKKKLYDSRDIESYSISVCFSHYLNRHSCPLLSYIYSFSLKYFYLLS